MDSFTIVLPFYNEVEVVEETVLGVCRWLSEQNLRGEVIAVDDGSSDGTGERLEVISGENPLLHVIKLDENLGYGTALTAGLSAASGDWIGFMDGDGQFRPDSFAKLLSARKEAAFISGHRVQRSDPAFRTLNARLYEWLVCVCLGVKVRDINCGMKIFHRDCWSKIQPQIATGALFNAEIYLRAKQQGINWVQVPVDHFPRLNGNPTGANGGVILKMFMELFRLKRSFAGEKQFDLNNPPG